jgi:hypothetical protein
VHAQSYNDLKKQQYIKGEQRKFEEEMREVTGVPQINETSKNLKRSLNNLYQWQAKVSNKNKENLDRYRSEQEMKISKMMSTKIINSNSEQIANRMRNPNEKIEDKLIRDGYKNKLRNQKLQEENFKIGLMSPHTEGKRKKKMDYKKVISLYFLVIEFL